MGERIKSIYSPSIWIKPENIDTLNELLEISDLYIQITSLNLRFQLVIFKKNGDEIILVTVFSDGEGGNHITFSNAARFITLYYRTNVKYNSDGIEWPLIYNV